MRIKKLLPALLILLTNCSKDPDIGNGSFQTRFKKSFAGPDEPIFWLMLISFIVSVGSVLFLITDTKAPDGKRQTITALCIIFLIVSIILLFVGRSY